MADRARERIGRLVFVDTAPISNGLSLLETYPPEVQQFLRERVERQGDGWRLPMPTWEEMATRMGGGPTMLTAEHEQQLQDRATPHPFGTYTQPLRLTRPDAEPLPKLGILCSFTEAQMRQMIEAGHPWGAELTGPEWRFVELPTSHWPMLSEPEKLTAILDEEGRR